MTELYLEDFAVGQTFASGRLTATEAEITRIAREFDPQSFHLDREAAKATFFGGNFLIYGRADHPGSAGAGGRRWVRQ